jgi:peptide/nickel transport system permease protein
MISAAVLAPVLPLQDPYVIEVINKLQPPLTPGHALGTDTLGRDVLSRIVWGARVSLVAGFVSTALSLTVGMPLGMVAGFLGGAVDEGVMRSTDIVMSFPPIVLAIAVVSGLGPGLRNAMIAVALVGLPVYVRLMRGVVLSVKEREFVLAAIAIGAGKARLLLRHVLPNVLAPIIVTASLDVGRKIVITASLSFLGLGTQPPTADWGNMLATGRDFITLAPHMATIPGVAIAVTVLGLNLFGDGLREALDPYMIGR